MPRLIKSWEELKDLESEHYKIEVELDNGCGWIVPKEETKETKDNYWEHHEYLSTHTFYGRGQHKQYTKILQKFGFDVELDNWDKDNEKVK